MGLSVTNKERRGRKGVRGPCCFDLCSWDGEDVSGSLGNCIVRSMRRGPKSRHLVL